MKSSHKKLLGLLVLLLFLIPLYLAARKMYREVRQPERNGSLIAAIKKNDASAVIACLTDGAHPNARDVPPDTRSPWRRIWDRLQGKPLQTDGEERTALLVALGMKKNGRLEFPPENIPLVKALLDAGAGVNAMDMFGETPLTSAAMGTKRETVRLLLDRGAKIDLPDGTCGAAALSWSALGNDPSLVKLLLGNGSQRERRSGS